VPGPVKLLAPFFAVPKTDDNKKMVYDGTRSGLNDAMWSPWSGMSFESSPYNTIQEIFMAEEIVRGNQSGINNILQWDKVILNLLGSLDYQPGRPWVRCQKT
jgi:hypothetical protein